MNSQLNCDKGMRTENENFSTVLSAGMDVCLFGNASSARAYTYTHYTPTRPPPPVARASAENKWCK